MSKKTLLAIAIAASLTPALAANSADTTSTDSSLLLYLQALQLRHPLHPSLINPALPNAAAVSPSAVVIADTLLM